MRSLIHVLVPSLVKNDEREQKLNCCAALQLFTHKIKTVYHHTECTRADWQCNGPRVISLPIGGTVYKMFITVWVTVNGVNLEWLCPGRLRTRSLWVLNGWIQFLLEQYEDAVHDAHNEVWRLSELPHRSNVGGFDGLHANIIMDHHYLFIFAH